jgi:PilZ domain
MEMSFSMIKARIGETSEVEERRRESRVPVELEARVRELGAEGVEARVLNISERGFMAETDGHFEVGTRVWLMLPGKGRVNALVKWVAGDRIGAEFSAPLPVEDIRSGD